MEEHSTKKKTSSNIRKNRRLYALCALVLFALAVFAVFKLSSDENKNQISKAVPVSTVSITKSGFQPATLSVKRGTRIIWTNVDGSLHQVASNPYPKDTGLPNLKSEILNNAQTYTYMADTTGSFGYHDQLNPTVNATLVVRKQ